VHDSSFLQGKSLFDSATILQVCWVWLVVCPLLMLLLALDGRDARSPDEAIPFHIVPLFFGCLILAPIVIFRGRKPDVSAPQRWLHLWLGLAVVPMFVLSMALEALLGWQSREEFGLGQVLVLITLLVWLIAMWKVMRRILRRPHAGAQ
jgi:hypothetical protein